MVSSRNKIIGIIEKEVSGNPRIDICILYGSAAEDKLSKTSDIDLAVNSKTALTTEERLDLSLKLSLKTGREVSVLDLQRIHGLILQEILSKGIRLKCKNSNLLASHIQRMYEYSEDIRPYQMMGIDKKIERYLHE